MGLFGGKKEKKEPKLTRQEKIMLKKTESELKQDEEVLAFLKGGKPTATNNSQIAVATQYRVFSRKEEGFTGINKQSLNYEAIHSVNTNSNNGYSVEIIGSNNKIVLDHVDPFKANDFVKSIEDKINNNDSTKSDQVINQTASPAQQLKEYKELLDLDIITQEEFDKKKKELLN